MRIITDGAMATGESVLTLGMFDGVHLGHRVLIEKAAVLSRRCGAPLVAGTFTAHPMSLVAPEKCPPMLTTLIERAKLMDALGVDLLYAQAFTRERMETAPEKYIAQLCTRFHPKHVVAGFDYTFGARGEGNAMLLTALGDVFGYQTHIVPRITYEGREVSSTAIRLALENSDAREARLLLGRPYQRELTAEADGTLAFENNGKLVPPDGTYRCLFRQGNASLPMIARLGGGLCRLTPEAPRIEADAALLFLSAICPNGR